VGSHQLLTTRFWYSGMPRTATYYRSPVSLLSPAIKAAAAIAFRSTSPSPSGVPEQPTTVSQFHPVSRRRANAASEKGLSRSSALHTQEREGMEKTEKRRGGSGAWVQGGSCVPGAVALGRPSYPQGSRAQEHRARKTFKEPGTSGRNRDREGAADTTGPVRRRQPRRPVSAGIRLWAALSGISAHDGSCHLGRYGRWSYDEGWDAGKPRPRWSIP